MVICLYLYAVMANYATYVNNNNNVYRSIVHNNSANYDSGTLEGNNTVYMLKLIDNWNRGVGTLDRGKYYALFLIVDYLPWLVVVSYFIIQSISIWKKKSNFLIHVFFAEGVNMLLCGLLHFITVLPDADNIGNDACFDQSRSVYGRWIFIPTLEFCGDMMWSGHTSHLIFSLIVIYWIFEDYQYPGSTKPRNIYWTIATIVIAFEMVFLVTFQFHYSSDVIIACIFISLFLTHQRFHNFIEYYKVKFENNLPVNDNQEKV